MNLTTQFEPAADGWFHIAPHGTFPHPNGALQVIDAEACDSMAKTFAEEAKQANFPGLLVDFDHFSHDPAQSTTAAGWLTALEHRDDGLYGQVRWSDLGHQALTGGRYRLVSPVWHRADCDSWTAPVGADATPTQHLRPRRLARLALTNDPNLPGLTPLTNRKEEGGRKKAKGGGQVDGQTTIAALQDQRAVTTTERIARLGLVADESSSASRDAASAGARHRMNRAEETPDVERTSVPTEAPFARRAKATQSPGSGPSDRESGVNLRAAAIRALKLPGTAGVSEIVEALRRQTAEVDALRNRCAELREAQADADLEPFAGVITNREVVRSQLLANREATLALLQALRQPEAFVPLHQPGAHRPNLQLLSPVAMQGEGDANAARRIANRARQLQSQLKIGHHAAFRLAEGEDAA